MNILRRLVLETLPGCQEKLSYGVPFFYNKKGICIIWPAGIPGGGIKEGVLLGFWQGNKLTDEDDYLIRGTNKKIYYRVFRLPGEINIRAVQKLLVEAGRIDASIH